MQPPSIFNDVIGPVMRGPSSSHCAASVRIGRIARDVMKGRIESVIVEYDTHGSLATTHATQGADMGLFGGLLGWEADDERLIESAHFLEKAGIQATVRVADLKDDHPNTYHLTLSNADETCTLTALSTGGGMIQLIAIDGICLSIYGDYYETLFFVEDRAEALLADLGNRVEADHIQLLSGIDCQAVEIKSQAFLPDALMEALKQRFAFRTIRTMAPVLPVLSRKTIEIPFLTCRQMLAYNQTQRLALWQLAAEYESARGNLTKSAVYARMQKIVRIMRAAMRNGIEGTHYTDRILGYQSGGFRACMNAGALLDAGILNPIIMYVSAMMEVKSAMGVIVAAPTAGSCGVLAGTCMGAAEAMALSEDHMVKAMLAAGMVGIFIAAQATFAAEVGGCQAECGVGSAMAAAALVTLSGGDTAQAISAAAMALQNVFGMVCDPVANRVEVPCLGKNIMAASNALACANMALAGFDAVIPLDEVINAMHQVGQSLPVELRCTGLGGLSRTPTAKAIAKQLALVTDVTARQDDNGQKRRPTDDF